MTFPLIGWVSRYTLIDAALMLAVVVILVMILSSFREAKK